MPHLTVTLADGGDMTFHFLPPGRFLMGSPESEEDHSDNEKQHRVTLSQGFWLGVTPVTQWQWQAVLGGTTSRFRGEDLPMECASWEDCQKYCVKLAERVGKGVGLPSEAEWEYACRAGTCTPFFFGRALSTRQANYDGNYPCGKGPKGVHRKKTTAVGSFPCNGWGLFDMHGNVWEWCQDRYGHYGKRTARDPSGAKRGAARVLRGGFWSGFGSWCRSAYRRKGAPALRGLGFGCRVVLCLD